MAWLGPGPARPARARPARPCMAWHAPARLWHSPGPGRSWTSPAQLCLLAAAQPWADQARPWPGPAPLAPAWLPPALARHWPWPATGPPQSSPRLALAWRAGPIGTAGQSGRYRPLVRGSVWDCFVGLVAGRSTPLDCFLGPVAGLVPGTALSSELLKTHHKIALKMTCQKHTRKLLKNC